MPFTSFFARNQGMGDFSYTPLPTYGTQPRSSSMPKIEMASPTQGTSQYSGLPNYQSVTTSAPAQQSTYGKYLSPATQKAFEMMSPQQQQGFSTSMSHIQQYYQGQQQQQQQQQEAYQQTPQYQLMQRFKNSPGYLTNAGPLLPGGRGGEDTLTNKLGDALLPLLQSGKTPLTGDTRMEIMRTIGPGALPRGRRSGEDISKLQKYSQVTGVPIENIQESLDPNWYGWNLINKGVMLPGWS